MWKTKCLLLVGRPLLATHLLFSSECAGGRSPFLQRCGWLSGISARQGLTMPVLSNVDELSDDADACLV